LSCGQQKVTFLSFISSEKTSSSKIKYGVSSLTQEMEATQYTYSTPFPFNTNTWMHKAVLTGLTPNALYRYQIQVEDTTSSVYQFKTFGTKFPVNLVLYGDMGTVFPVGFMVAREITKHFKERPFDIVSHAGDIAYADFGTNGRGEIQAVYDVLQRQIEPYAKFVPYMGLFQFLLNFPSFSWKS
jgi:phosphodiesterase/alkaline phosphatase D-like protein